ncbi:MAG: RNA polymerase sigma-70 factor [Saprospiraceae bacterium]|nr:RNA polymerase sigma-70 factor [Saprospiraceae bacterium]
MYKTPNSYQAYTDFDLIALLKSDDISAFDTLYSRYFSKLYNHAYEKLHDRYLAQEVVQELFVSFWQNRYKVEVHTSLASYFFVAIRYLIINQFKKQLAYEQKIDKITLTQSHISDETNEWLDVTDLQAEYQAALQKLPEKCREVFVMSRNGATNKEIGEALDISVKTVEQHITKALRILRILLNSHLNTLVGTVFLAISKLF